MNTSIFLGGTVAGNDWRSSFIADLVAAGVPKDGLFDPVVPDWTAECQVAEDAAKATAQFNMFYLADPKQAGNPYSVYSTVEAIMALFDKPSNTVVVFDNAGIEGHLLKAINKTEKDLRKRFPGANIFSTRQEALDYFVARLKGSTLNG